MVKFRTNYKRNTYCSRVPGFFSHKIIFLPNSFKFRLLPIVPTGSCVPFIFVINGRYSVLWRTGFTASFAIIQLIHEPRHVVNEWLSVSLVVHFGFQVLLMKPSILSLGFLKISLFIIDTIQNLWKVKPVLGNCPQNYEW